MLKKNLAICLALTLLLSGCAANKNTSNNKAGNSNSTTVSDNKQSSNKPTTSVEKATATPTPTKNAEPASTTKAFTPIAVPDASALSTKAISWSWMYSVKDNADLLSKYHGYGQGDTSQKIIYLTFDEGYEYGYTASILDTLKANDVHAAFFCTDFFVTGNFNGVKNADLVKRMANEGHLICNHSVHHKSMPTFTDESAFDAELTGVENDVNALGFKMSHFFRPPEGTFSEQSLYYTQKLGYRTVFFNLAYVDYDTEKQPDPETAKATILKNTKPGMICLLHAVSKTNATILDSLLKEWKAEGYEFKSLNDLP